LDPLSNPLSEGYVYQIVVNGVQLCAIYEGLNQNISGVDNVQIVGVIGDSAEGACLQCIPSTPEPIYDCLVVHSECAGGSGTINVNPGTIINGRPSYSFNFPLNPNFSSYTYTIYWDDINIRWIASESTTSLPGSYLNLDIPMPIGLPLEWEISPISASYLECIQTFSSGFYTTNTGLPCPTPTPTPTPTPSQAVCLVQEYLITNAGLTIQEINIFDCDGNSIAQGATPGDTLWCSSSTPTTNSTSLTVTLTGNLCA
jgi:hypothetical protein